MEYSFKLQESTPVYAEEWKPTSALFEYFTTTSIYHAYISETFDRKVDGPHVSSCRCRSAPLGLRTPRALAFRPSAVSLHEDKYANLIIKNQDENYKPGAEIQGRSQTAPIR